MPSWKTQVHSQMEMLLHATALGNLQHTTKAAHCTAPVDYHSGKCSPMLKESRPSEGLRGLGAEERHWLQTHQGIPGSNAKVLEHSCACFVELPVCPSSHCTPKEVKFTIFRFYLNESDFLKGSNWVGPSPESMPNVAFHFNSKKETLNCKYLL